MDHQPHSDVHTGSRKGEWMELRSSNRMLTAAQWQQYLEQHQRFPRKLLQKLIRQQQFQTDNKRLRLQLFPAETAEVEAQWYPLDILYEDDFCLVAYKPSGMPVHPTRPGQGGTLNHAVAAHYQHTGQQCRIRHIHRLDEDTTGAVLYAKNEFAHLILDADMRSKAIQRTYIAIVQGKLHPPEGVINEPIGRDRHHARRRRVSSTGEAAVTRYRTLQQLDQAALVELRLETGRTHQIRVHLSHLGAPLVGDQLYGGSQRLITRQALHGSALDFNHPWTGEAVHISAPSPADFLDAWQHLNQGANF